MDGSSEDSVGHVEMKDSYQRRRKLASIGKDFASSDRIRLAHEKRIRELNERERSYKERFRRCKEATQLDLLDINAYRHVYRLYSYSSNDIHNRNLHDRGLIVPHHTTEPHLRSKSSYIGDQTSDIFSGFTHDMPQHSDHLLQTNTRNEVSNLRPTCSNISHKRTCNTTNWKYVLLPSHVNVQQKQENVREEPRNVKTKPRVDRLKLWETATYRTNAVSKVFPENCKTPFSYCRMINDKATKLRNDWSPTNVRKMKARCILDSEQCPSVTYFDRTRTTSALFRNHRELQLSRQGSKHESTSSCAS